MSIAVLSPCVLEVRNKPEQVHYSQLSQLINNIYSYTELKFQLYRKAPFESYKMEIPVYEKNPILNNFVMINVYGKIQKMLLKDYVDLEGYEPAILPSEFRIGKDSLSNAFCSYLSYLKGNDSVLFVGEDNFSVPRPIDICADTTFTMNASTYIQLELSDVLLPYLKQIDDCDSIFPRADFCAKYNHYVLETIKSKGMGQAEKNALFEKVGSTVATYNMYKKNKRLSQLNTTRDKKRIVFEKNTGKKYYLSLDLESGGFEVFDRSFRHLGQFSFSCEQVKDAEPLTHVLHH